MLLVDWKNVVRHWFSSSHRRRGSVPVVGIERLEVRSVMSVSTPAVVAASELHSLDEIPQLDSNPDATVQLFLDFDGHFEPNWVGHRNVTSPVFSLDEDRTNYSDWELAVIRETWASVAEDYAPFNINVTTVDRGDFSDGHGMRIVIGGSPNDWYGSSCGGVSFINSFTNSQPNVAYVFSDYGWPSRDEGNFLANAASHEAGHAFGLSHQAEYDANGGFVNCYRRGDDHSGPIMGSTEASQRGVWANSSSDSATTTQDDMSVIARTANGFGYRADDHGDDASSDSSLTIVNGRLTGLGVITQTSDRDAFRFQTEGGTAVFTVSTNPFGANLVVRAELRNASGQTLVTAIGNDTDPACLQANLPSGEYVLVVSSNGEYGSVGEYSVAGSVTSEPAGTAQTPMNFTAGSQYGLRHELNWTAATDAVGYRVYRRARAGSSEALIETLPAGTTRATITVSKTPFASQSERWSGEYRVEAFNARGVSTTAWRAVAHQFQIPQQTGRIDLQSLSETSVRLTWRADPTSEFQKLVVMQYLENSSTTFFYERTVLLPANQSEFTLDGLISGKSYAFAIVGVTPAGRAGATYRWTMPHPEAPTAPQSLQATRLDNQVFELTWAPVAGATGYRVYTYSDSGTWPSAILTTNSYRTWSLAYNTDHRFIVEAINAKGATQARFEPIRLVPPPTGATNLRAAALSWSSVQLTWSDGQAETGYRIYQQNGNDRSLIATLPADATSYSVTGLIGNTAYQFSVEAFNADGTKATSFPTVTTPFTPPTAPGNFVAVPISPTQARLSWTDSAGETTYRVERITNGVTTSTVISAGSTAYTASGLLANREYQFRVIAVNNGGNAATNSLTVRTPEVPVSAPSGLQASAIGTTSLSLRWNDGSNETGYRLYRADATGEQLLAQLAANTTQFSVTGLTDSTSYRFRVAAFNAGSEATSNAINVTTLSVAQSDNALTTARDLGTLGTTPTVVHDFVGSSDTQDYFRFTLAQARSFGLRLSGMTSDADVQLLDAQGRVVASSARGGNVDDNINLTLAAGTYFVRVYQYRGDTNYDLTLSSSVLVTNDNSLTTARDLGALGTTPTTARDFVGSSDTQDYFRFTLTQARSFGLRLSGMTSDADVQLLDAQGRVVASSARGGSADDEINLTLSAGTYFVRVYQYRGDTNYDLTLSNSALVANDNSLTTARDLGALGTTPTTVRDSVGSSDTQDYLRFTLTQGRSFSLRLSGMTSDADVQLLDAQGRVVASSTCGGSAAEDINLTLTAGTYFVRVYQFLGDTNYDLTMSAI